MTFSSVLLLQVESHTFQIISSHSRTVMSPQSHNFHSEQREPTCMQIPISPVVEQLTLKRKFPMKSPSNLLQIVGRETPFLTIILCILISWLRTLSKIDMFDNLQFKIMYRLYISIFPFSIGSTR